MVDELYLDGFQKQIIQEHLSGCISLTTDRDHEDFVEGFSLLDDCLWPEVLTVLDTQLSFVTTTGNLKLFHCNYRKAVEFLHGLSNRPTRLSAKNSQQLLQKFNLQTYADFVALEVSDKLTQRLDTSF